VRLLPSAEHPACNAFVRMGKREKPSTQPEFCLNVTRCRDDTESSKREVSKKTGTFSRRACFPVDWMATRTLMRQGSSRKSVESLKPLMNEGGSSYLGGPSG